MNTKPKIAIYDFTDCEGCEVKIASIGKALELLPQKIDIVNWRLGQNRIEKYPYDITLIEGAPIKADEIEQLKELRDNSKTLIALGACAALGGVPAIMPENERKIWYEKIYGNGYIPHGIDAKPLSAYVNINFSIHGCPIDESEFLRALQEILAGKKPSYRPYSVCFDCKIKENNCRIIEGKPCMGPITQGGCKAVCVSGGSPCYGCFGLREEANIPALKKIFTRITDTETAKRYFSMFHSKTDFNLNNQKEKTPDRD